jgi:hypothetical protein
MIRPRRAVLGPRLGPPQAGVALPQKQQQLAASALPNASPTASSASLLPPKARSTSHGTRQNRSTAPNKLFPRTILVSRYLPRLRAAARPGRCLPLLD